LKLDNGLEVSQLSNRLLSQCPDELLIEQT